MFYKGILHYNMQKCSFEDGCKERVTYACKCMSPNLYFCDNHFLRHMRTPGDHLSECMVVELSRESDKRITTKAQGIDQLFKEV